MHRRSKQVLLVAAPMVFTLIGCSSGTPDCGDGETLDLLEQVVEQALDRENPTTEGERAFVDGLRDGYEFINVRAMDYNESIDRYACKAALKFSYDGHEQETEIAYDVFSDQSSGETLIEYPRDFARRALFRFGMSISRS